MAGDNTALTQAVGYNSCVVDNPLPKGEGIGWLTKD
jgi:hypothetical protein